MSLSDLDNILTDGFDALHLQANAARQKPPIDLPFTTFSLFAAFPTEIRLKIIEHALPIYEVIEVSAKVVLADPAFGLYVTFSITPPRRPAGDSSFGVAPKITPKGWYHSSRCLQLLSVNREWRSTYLENFPLTLPSGPQIEPTLYGKIRYSPEDMIYIRNIEKIFASMLAPPIDSTWRLQKCFDEIELLMVPIEWSIRETVTARALVRFTKLKEVRMKIWDGFRDTPDAAAGQIRKGMQIHIDNIKDQLETWKKDVDEDYFVPDVVLAFRV